MDVSSLPLLGEGTTDGIVELRRSAKGVFVLAMVAGPQSRNENRWTLPFARAIHKAFDAVEATRSKDPKGSPAALLVMSTSPKFFSNGIDVEWLMSPDTPKADVSEWDALTMPCFARPLLLPMTTVCAIGGHAFGAGLMFALGCDRRMQARGRGYLCAPEVDIGVPIPQPELTLFRHDMPANAFHETVLSARRWGADDALRAGIVHQACEPEALLGQAMAYAEQRAQALARSSAVYPRLKAQVKGYVAKEIFDFQGETIQRNRATLSAGLLRHADELAAHEPAAVSHPWSARAKL